MDMYLDIFRDVETDEIILSDHGYIIAKFDRKLNDWVKLENEWLAKPGSVNTIDLKIALMLCNYKLPDTYTSYFRKYKPDKSLNYMHMFLYLNKLKENYS